MLSFLVPSTVTSVDHKCFCVLLAKSLVGDYNYRQRGRWSGTATVKQHAAIRDLHTPHHHSRRRCDNCREYQNPSRRSVSGSALDVRDHLHFAWQGRMMIVMAGTGRSNILYYTTHVHFCITSHTTPPLYWPVLLPLQCTHRLHCTPDNIHYTC